MACLNQYQQVHVKSCVAMPWYVSYPAGVWEFFLFYAKILIFFVFCIKQKGFSGPSWMRDISQHSNALSILM